LKHSLAAPVLPWERLKIGGGTPPVLTKYGWLIIYHGVSEIMEPDDIDHQLCYSAGVMVFSKEHPLVIRYRSAEPLLTLSLPQEQHGTMQTSCSPPESTGAATLAHPIAMTSIMEWPTAGVARFDLPDTLPFEGDADPPEAKVCDA
jgi:hypothetical protein